MKKTILFIAVALVLFIARPATGLAELDPNILWVSDSTVGRLDNIIVQPNGNIIGNYGGLIKEIDGTNGKLIRSFQKINNYNNLSSIDLSDDGKYLLCSYTDVVLVDLITLEKKVLANRGAGAVFCNEPNKIAYYTIDSKATGSDSTIVILDLITGKKVFIKTEEAIFKIAFSPDGRFMEIGRAHV